MGQHQTEQQKDQPLHQGYDVPPSTLPRIIAHRGIGATSTPCKNPFAAILDDRNRRKNRREQHDQQQAAREKSKSESFAGLRPHRRGTIRESPVPNSSQNTTGVPIEPTMRFRWRKKRTISRKQCQGSVHGKGGIHGRSLDRAKSDGRCGR